MSVISRWPQPPEEDGDWGGSRDKPGSGYSQRNPLSSRHQGTCHFDRGNARWAHRNHFMRQHVDHRRGRRHRRYRDALQLPSSSHAPSSQYRHLATEHHDLPSSRGRNRGYGSTLMGLATNGRGTGVSGCADSSAAASHAAPMFPPTSAMRRLRSGIPGSLLSDVLSGRVPSLTAVQELLQGAFATAYTDACYRCLISQDVAKSFGPNEALQRVVDQWRADAFEESQLALRQVVEQYRHDLLQVVMAVVNAEDAALAALHGEASASEEKIRYSLSGNDDGAQAQRLRSSLTDAPFYKPISKAGQASGSASIDCPEVNGAALHYSTPALGRVLVYRGFFLCFWHSSTGERFGQLEYRACRWVLEAHVPHVHVPLCFHFRYKGRGVTAMSLIPVDENLTTVTEQNPEVAALAQQLTSVLSLLPCDTGPITTLGSGLAAEATASATFLTHCRGGSSANPLNASFSTDGEALPDTRFVPRSVRVHFAQDGRYYFLRNHQWFVPWLNSQHSRDAAVQRLSYVNPRLLAACGVQVSCRACQRDASFEESRAAMEFMRHEVDIGIPRLLHSDRDSYVRRQQRAAALHLRARRAMRAAEEAHAATHVTHVWMGGKRTDSVPSAAGSAALSSSASPSSADATEQAVCDGLSDADWEAADVDVDDAARVRGLEGTCVGCDFRLPPISLQPFATTSVVARFSARGYPKSLLGLLLLSLWRYPAAPQGMTHEVKREILFRGLKAFILVRVYDARFGVEQLLARLPHENAHDVDRLWGEVDTSPADSDREFEPVHGETTGVSLGKTGEAKERGHVNETAGFLSAASTHHLFHPSSACVGNDGRGTSEVSVHVRAPTSERRPSPPAATPSDLTASTQQMDSANIPTARHGLRASLSSTQSRQGGSVPVAGVAGVAGAGCGTGGGVAHLGRVDSQGTVTPGKGKWWDRLWRHMSQVRNRWWGDAAARNGAEPEGCPVSHLHASAHRNRNATPTTTAASAAQDFSVGGRGRGRVGKDTGAGNAAVGHPPSQSFALHGSRHPVVTGAGASASSVSTTRWADFATTTERVLAAFLQYDGTSHPSHAFCDSTRRLEALCDFEAAATPSGLRSGRGVLGGGSGSGSFTSDVCESVRSSRHSTEEQRQHLGAALWSSVDALNCLYTEQILPFIYRKFRLSVYHERALQEPLNEEDRATVYVRVLEALGASVEDGQVQQVVPVVRDFSPSIASVAHAPAGGTAKPEGHTTRGKKIHGSLQGDRKGPTNSRGHSIAGAAVATPPGLTHTVTAATNAANRCNPLQRPLSPLPSPFPPSVRPTVVGSSLACSATDIPSPLIHRSSASDRPAVVAVPTSAESAAVEESFNVRDCYDDNAAADTDVPLDTQACDTLSAVVLPLDPPAATPQNAFILPEWIVWRAKALVRRFLPFESNCAAGGLGGGDDDDDESAGMHRNRNRHRRKRRTSSTRSFTLLSDMRGRGLRSSHAVVHVGPTGARLGSAEAAGLVPLLALLYNVPASALPAALQRPQLPGWRVTAELILAHLRTISSSAHLLWSALELYELADASTLFREVRPDGISAPLRGEASPGADATVPSERSAHAVLDAEGFLEDSVSQDSPPPCACAGEVHGGGGDAKTDSPALPPPEYALALALFHRRQTLRTTSDRVALIRVLQRYAAAIRSNPTLARSVDLLQIETDDDNVVEKDGALASRSHLHGVPGQMGGVTQHASDGTDGCSGADGDQGVRGAVISLFQEVLLNADNLLARLGNPYGAQYRQHTADWVAYLEAAAKSAVCTEASTSRGDMMSINSASSKSTTSALQQSDCKDGDIGVADTRAMDMRCRASSIVLRLQQKQDAVLEHMWKQLATFCKSDFAAAQDALQRAVTLYRRREAAAKACGGGVTSINGPLLELERDPEVEETLQRACDLFTISEGPSSPFTLRALCNMALYWFTVGCYAEFLDWIQRLRRCWCEGGPEDVRQLLLTTLTANTFSSGGASVFSSGTWGNSTLERHSSATSGTAPDGTEDTRGASVLQSASGCGGGSVFGEPIPFLHRVKVE